MAEKKSVCFADMFILPLMAASDENLRKGNLFNSCQGVSLNDTLVVVLEVFIILCQYIYYIEILVYK